MPRDNSQVLLVSRKRISPNIAFDKQAAFLPAPIPGDVAPPGIVQRVTATLAGAATPSTGAYFSRASDSKLCFAATQNTAFTQATFSFWVYRSAVNADMTLFSKANLSGANGTNGSYALFLSGTTHGRFDFYFYTASSTLANVTFNLPASPDFAWAADRWYHIYIEIDGSQTGNAKRIRIFVNGAAITMAAGSGAGQQTGTDFPSSFRVDTGTFQIGSWLLSGAPTFNGGFADWLALPLCLSGGDGTGAAQLATAQQLYNLGYGRTPHTNCVAVATSNISPLSVAKSIDGHFRSPGDRILLTGQTNAAENGVWIYNSVGDWTRPADFSIWEDAVGAYVFVTSGDTLAGTSWICTNANTSLVTGVLGLTGQTWSQMTAQIASGATVFNQIVRFDETSNSAAAVDSGTHALSLSRVNAPSFQRNLVTVGVQGATAIKFFSGSSNQAGIVSGARRPERVYEGIYDPNAVGTGLGGISGGANPYAVLFSPVSNWANNPTFSVFGVIKVITAYSGEFYWLSTGDDATYGTVDNSWALIGILGSTAAGLSAGQYAPAIRYDGSALPLHTNPFGDSVPSGQPNSKVTNLSTGTAPLAGSIYPNTGDVVAYHCGSIDLTRGGTGGGAKTVAGPYRIDVNGIAQVVYVEDNGIGVGADRYGFMQIPTRNGVQVLLTNIAIRTFLVVSPAPSPAEIAGINANMNASRTG